jgi:hypothetical protein
MVDRIQQKGPSFVGGPIHKSLVGGLIHATAKGSFRCDQTTESFDASISLEKALAPAS